MAPRHSSSNSPSIPPSRLTAGQVPPGVHLGEWGAELVGTAILILCGLSAICLDFAPGSPVQPVLHSASARLLLTGVLFAGSGSLVAVSPLGRLSGAHLNPAVTIAFWMRAMVHRHDLFGYIGAQFFGAALGVLVALAAWGPRLRQVDFGATLPHAGVSPTAAVALEAVMTAVLVGTILAMVSHHRTMRLTPLAVWLLVAILVWQGAGFTGTGLNPARSLWPDMLAGRLDVYWVYVVGPLAGSAAAAGITGLLLRRGPHTAKLFHDPSYRSVFKSGARHPSR
ncbi:MAG: MIP/aquaporin family protein [Candidatus Dormibacteria bacterium]